MTVAVCIPAYEELDYLPGLLRSIVNQTLFPDEIVIADSSNDHTHSLTREIASRFGARVTRTIKGNVSRARNDAALMTRSDVLLFADADNILAPNYIASVANVLPGKIKQGRVAYYNGNPLAESLYTIFDRLRSQPVGSSMAITRDTFSAVNGFDERFVLANGDHGEEADLANRVRAYYGAKCYVRAWETTVYTSARRINKSGLTRYLTGNPWEELGVRTDQYISSLRRH